MPEPLVPLPAPPQSCLPNTPQALLDFVAQYLAVQFPTGYTQVVISDSTPAPADQDKIWLKVDGSGNPIGFFLYAGGSWLPITPQNVFFATDTGSANALSIVITNYPYATQQQGLFIVKAAATNTGASTLTINAFAAVPIKIAGADPYAAAIIVDHYYIFSYTGTTFELLNPSDAIVSPTLAVQFVYDLTSGTPAPAIPNGDNVIPFNLAITAATWATFSAPAVALGPGTYFIQASVDLHDDGATPGASLQLCLKNGGAFLNWQDIVIENTSETTHGTVTACLSVATGGSASITAVISISTGNLLYGVDVTSARHERPATLTIMKFS